jgi:molybdate transport system substrate-binding protein
MKRMLALMVLVIGLLFAGSGIASEIHVMSGGAPKEVFSVLVPKFERQTGYKVKLDYAVITALRQKIAAGEQADVFVMPVPVLDGLQKEGKAQSEGRRTFGTVGVSVIVKDGAKEPDISSEEEFRAAMLAARSIVHATPGQTPSGDHMAKVMNQLGITSQIKNKVIFRPALDGGAQLVAAGDAEIGIYPTSEVAHVKGIKIVGALPRGIALDTVYGGATAASSEKKDAAMAFVAFMAARENRAVWKEGGFEPPEP